MSVLNSNTWYQLINDGQDEGSGASAGCPYPSPGYCSVYIRPFNHTAPDPWQLWQFFQTGYGNSEYIIRLRYAGPASYLGVVLGPSATYNTEISTPRIQPFLDNSTTWTLGTWGDGTYYMYSAANGSDWRMDLQENGSWLYFSSNLTSGEGGLRWEFKAIEQINDTAYSTIPISASSTSSATTITTGLPSATAALTTAFTTSTTTTTSSITQSQTSTQSPTSNANNSSTAHGLSSYSEAAIGASIGGAAILVIIFVALRIVLRRRRTGGHVYGALGTQNGKSAEATQSNVYGTSGNELSELPATRELAELPGHDTVYEGKK